MFFKNLLAIGTGGFLGAIFRFIVSSRINTLTGADFPYGTLTVNAVGSLLLGFLTRYFLEHLVVSDLVRTGLLVGFLGAFTTFSTFSYESVMLIQNGESSKAILNILANGFICIFLCIAGLKLAELL